MSRLVSSVRLSVRVLSEPRRGFVGVSCVRLMTLGVDLRPDLVLRRGPWLGSSRVRHEMLVATSGPVVVSN